MAQLVVVRNSRIDEVAGFSAPINPNKYGTLPGHIMGGKDDIVSFTRWARDDVRDSEDYCGYENPLSQRVAYLLLMAEAYNAPVRVARAEVSTDDPSVMDASNREKGKALGLSGRPLYRASKSREVCVRGGCESVMLIDELQWASNEPTEIELAAAEDVIFEYGFKFGWRNRRDPRSLSNNTLLDALGYAILIGDAEGSTCLMKIALQRRGIIEAR